MKKINKKLELKKEAITILDNLQSSNVFGGGESTLSWWEENCCFSHGPKCTANTGPQPESGDAN